MVSILSTAFNILHQGSGQRYQKEVNLSYNFGKPLKYLYCSMILQFESSDQGLFHVDFACSPHIWAYFLQASLMVQIKKKEKKRKTSLGSFGTTLPTQ